MRKDLVFIISAMRTGSTLLKALLATRDDISDLPECHFGKFHNITTEKPIVVVKSPAYYNELDYPILPNIPSKKIVLIRNPYDTVVSLQKMNNTVHPGKAGILNDEVVLVSYWMTIYQNILERINLEVPDTLLIRYEDMVTVPIATTKKVFKFLGCTDKSGINHYFRPVDYEWKWGQDDGGEMIKTLKVKRLKKERNNTRLCHIIRHNREISTIMEKCGYKNLGL